MGWDRSVVTSFRNLGADCCRVRAVGRGEEVLAGL